MARQAAGARGGPSRPAGQRGLESWAASGTAAREPRSSRRTGAAPSTRRPPPMRPSSTRSPPAPSTSSSTSAGPATARWWSTTTSRVAPGTASPSLRLRRAVRELAGYRVPLVRRRHAAAGRPRRRAPGPQGDRLRGRDHRPGPAHPRDPENFVATTLEDCLGAPPSSGRSRRSGPPCRSGRDLRGTPRPAGPGCGPASCSRCPGSATAAPTGWRSTTQLARLGVIRACRRAGIGVMVWTVDSDRLIDHFVGDRHVDVLITNRPRHAVARRRATASGVQAEHHRRGLDDVVVAQRPDRRADREELRRVRAPGVTVLA